MPEPLKTQLLTEMGEIIKAASSATKEKK